MQYTPVAGAPAANQYGVFAVEAASPKQVAFVQRLISERDISQLPATPEVSAAMAAALGGSINKRHCSRLIDTLMALPMAARTAQTAQTGSAASEKQVALITKLAAERDWVCGRPGDNPAADAVQAVLDGESVTKRAASAAIDHLFGCAKIPGKAKATVSEGFYLRDGAVFKVQRAVHGSGNLYAKRLKVEGDHGTWTYEAGAISKLTPEMVLTLEAAKEFGRLYGICCRCGATLTDEGSIEAGIGPVCATRF